MIWAWRKVFFTQSNGDIVKNELWTKENCKTIGRKAFGVAVINSGCAENICSTKWLESYLDALPEAQNKVSCWEANF